MVTCVKLALIFTMMAASAFASTKIYDADGDRLFENLEERLAVQSPNQEISVIILYKQQTPLAGTFAARLNHIAAQNVKYSYRNIPAVAVSMTADQIREAQADPWVEHIELDQKLTVSMKTARSSFGVQDLKKQFGFTGDGDGIKNNFSINDVVIAVIDTGVNESHPDLAGKVLYWKDFVNNKPSSYDDQGHGTMVAGVALGSGRLKSKFAGVAPQAGLVAIKAFDKNGFANEADAIAAIDEVIAKRAEFHIKILNLSFSSGGSSGGKDALSVACNHAVTSGIVVTVVAGNSGPGPKTIGTPGAASKVITVGAGADLGEEGFFLADFSGRGPTADGRMKPDLWAPGINVTVPRRRGGYTKQDGTSFACPFVAGVVALMLDANPNLTPAKIKSILKKTAARWGPGKQNSEAGAGRLQAYQAVVHAATITENLDPPDVPEIFFDKSSIAGGQTKTHTISVVGRSFPIAITCIIYNYPSSFLQMRLFDPQGVLAASTSRISRQQTLHIKPVLNGDYRLEIEVTGESSSYLLDISADLSN